MFAKYPQLNMLLNLCLEEYIVIATTLSRLNNLDLNQQKG